MRGITYPEREGGYLNGPQIKGFKEARARGLGSRVGNPEKPDVA